MLRCYQQTGVSNVVSAFEAGIPVVLLVMATGTGKTHCAAHIAKLMLNSGRVMVVAHRDELLRQAEKTFTSVCGIMPVFEKAKEYAPEDAIIQKPPIVISSVQTQNSGDEQMRRMTRFDPNEFSLLWIDEAHRSVAAGYVRLIQHYRQNPNLRVLLVTATPDRSDERGLKEICDHVAFRYELPDAIKDGYLVPIRQRRVTIDGLDFTRVSTSGDDFLQEELEAALMVEKPLHGVAHATIEAACGFDIGYLESIRDDVDRVQKIQTRLNGSNPKLTLLFAVSVSHAERLAEIINRWIPGAADSISGKTPPDMRKRILKEFKTGKIRFLANCQLLGEGYDEPGLELIAMSAPTKSRIRYSQGIGRGTRPLEEIASLLGECTESAERREIIQRSNKPMLHVLDFVGNSGQHKLVCTVDLLGIARPQPILDRATELIDSSGMDSQEAIEQAGREIEQEQDADAALAEWQSEQDDALDERQVSAAAMRRMNIVATASYRVKNVSAFGSGYESPQINANAATADQVKYLVQMGINPTTAATYQRGQAGAILQKLRKAKTADWQQWRLRKDFGMTEGEIANLNYFKAMDVIHTRKENR